MNIFTDPYTAPATGRRMKRSTDETGKPTGSWYECPDCGEWLNEWSTVPALYGSEKIEAGNPAPPGKWLSDIEMAAIARKALKMKAK